MRTKRSHLVMERVIPNAKRAICVIPMHDEVAVGTLRGILRQAGVTVEEFIQVL